MKLFFLTLVTLFFIQAYCHAKSKEVNIYSARQEVLMRELIDNFEVKENIKVNIIFSKANQLIKKIEMEGEYTDADILLTVDVARLLSAKKKGLFKTIDSSILKNQIPSIYRDKDNQWYGMSLRARIFIYHKERVADKELKGYLGLMDSNWKSRLLVRSSNNVYNQSLVSAMIYNYGRETTKDFLSRFTKNFARNPSGGDRDQIRAVVAGEGDIALVNSYYFIKMKKNDTEKKLNKIRVHFPFDEKMKTHINISGAGIIKYSKNTDNAIKFLEFLISDEAQKVYAEKNFEYPIKEGLKISSFLKKYSIQKKDSLDLNVIADNNKEALMMMGKAGWR